MKRAATILLAAALALGLAACSAAPDSSVPAPDSSAPAAESAPASEPAAAGSAETADGGRILVAYFTVPETDGVDAVAGASRVVTDGEVLGNTQYIAQLIARQTGGELFAIQTVQEYPGSHDALLEFAYNERAGDARPELAAALENPGDYDVVFLGYPNWNADLPMPLYTFLESYDFAGKTIVPFVTHGGSGFSRTISTIQSLQPEATVLEDGFSVARSNMATSAQAAMDWASGLNMA